MAIILKLRRRSIGLPIVPMYQKPATH